jgi:hypothetical protein
MIELRVDDQDSLTALRESIAALWPALSNINAKVNRQDDRVELSFSSEMGPWGLLGPFTINFEVAFSARPAFDGKGVKIRFELIKGGPGKLVSKIMGRGANSTSKVLTWLMGSIGPIQEGIQIGPEPNTVSVEFHKLPPSMQGVFAGLKIGELSLPDKASALVMSFS